MVDYSLRAAYLLSLEGGNISALARSFGVDAEGQPNRVSRRTLRRMLQGRETTGAPVRPRTFDKDIRERFNRVFRRRATPQARREEQKERGVDKEHRVQPELQNESQARAYAITMQRLGLHFWVSARVAIAYKDDTGDVDLAEIETEYTTLFTHGMAHASIDIAKANLENVLTQFINADHEYFGNSPTRIIIDPLAESGDRDVEQGSSYAHAFYYRVWRPLAADNVRRG